jgi:hypothetical protein
MRSPFVKPLTAAVLGLLLLMLPASLTTAFAACDPSWVNRTFSGKASSEKTRPGISLPFYQAERNGFKPRAGSLGESVPVMESILDDLNSLMISGEAFRSRRQTVGDPILSWEEYRDFLMNRLEIFKSGAQNFLKQTKARDPLLALTIEPRLAEVFAEIESKSKELGQSVTRGGRTEGDYFGFFQTQTVKLKAVLAELSAVSSLPSVKAYSVRLQDQTELKLALKTTIQDHRARAFRIEGHLEYLTQKYPDLMKNPKVEALKNSKPNSEQVFDALESWLHDLEWDLLIERDGKKVLVEIKLNQEPMNLSMFQEIKSKHSYETQLARQVQVIQFLGLANRFQIATLYTRGVSKQVIARIEALGATYLE